MWPRKPGVNLAGGLGDGVILHLHSVSTGARLQLGTRGLIIKLK